SYGELRSAFGLAVLAGALQLVHPWAVGLLAPPLLTFWIVVAWRTKAPGRLPLTLAVAAGLAVLPFLARIASPSDHLADAAFSRLLALVGNPASLWPLPVFVDPVGMLGPVALVLAAAGLVL